MAESIIYFDFMGRGYVGSIIFFFIYLSIFTIKHLFGSMVPEDLAIKHDRYIALLNIYMVKVNIVVIH